MENKFHLTGTWDVTSLMVPFLFYICLKCRKMTHLSCQTEVHDLCLSRSVFFHQGSSRGSWGFF